MKITFVTASHTTYDETKSVDVARQRDLDQARERVEELDAKLTALSKKLMAFEKSQAQLEQSLAKVDTRLRDDCREIFADLIKESLDPVFTVMRQVAEACGVEVPPAEETDAEKVVKKTPRKTIEKTVMKTKVSARKKAPAEKSVAKKTTTRKKATK